MLDTCKIPTVRRYYYITGFHWQEVEGEKKGAKKKKKGKKGKGRKRKEKDLTPDRTTESLYEELVLNGEVVRRNGYEGRGVCMRERRRY